MRLEVNTNGSWRIVSIINPDHLRHVMDTVQALDAFLLDDPAFRITVPGDKGNGRARWRFSTRGAL